MRHPTEVAIYRAKFLMGFLQHFIWLSRDWKGDYLH
jgi:hypothetical protein